MMTRFLPVGFAAVSILLVGCGVDDESVGNAEGEVTNLPSCVPSLACNAPDLPAVRKRSWRHWFKSTATVTQGFPNHRGRDVFVNPDAPQTIIAQFAYGVTDVDLVDEEIDVFVQKDCTSGWEKLGTTVTTSSDTDHPAVEGVEDHGGRVYFEIPAEKRLGPGLHRVRLVVAGDRSSTDLLIDVVPRDTPVFISDVDGTLTSSETAEYLALLTAQTPGTHEGAPEALRALVAKGYHPVYVTARPEWLTGRTREFLATHGFPLGVVHTSLSNIGAGFGESAANFKKGELADLARKGLTPQWGFGNKTSDSDAYQGIPVAQQRVYYKISGDFVGRKIESYSALVPELDALDAVCR